MKPLGFYDPYTYQPMMKSFYMGRPMPEAIAKVAAENPQAAAHIVSVWQFMTWLNQSFPNLYAVLSPKVKDPAKVVISGEISPRTAASISAPVNRMGAMSGKLGGAFDDGGMPSYSSPSDPVSEWGKTVSDLLGKYLVYDQQRKLIDLNIKRAEQGLPPVDATSYGAGVSVGLSPAAQKLGYLAVGGLVLAGLMGMFRRR